MDHNLPSISLAVAREGKIVWEQGFGWADRENRVPATEHTLCSIASTSKPITATGLMVLKERKLVDLDHPTNDYLGDARLRARVGNADEAALRRVANHTSGLPLHYQFFYADEAFHPPTRDETIRRFGNLVTAPGERYQYSNLGFGVLDYVIARTSGKSFPDFMREEVFLPLGMTHTSIGIGPGLEPHQAIRYTPEGTRIPFYEFDHDGASAVYSSAHDLARFAMFHMKEHLADQRPILSDATIDEMQSPTAHPSGGRGYGVGWSIGQSRGYQTVDHDGGMPGVSTMCMFLPTERIAVVVLGNSNSSLPSSINDMILKILLPEDKPKTPSPSLSRFNPPPDKFVPGSELVGTWKGHLATYQGELPLVLVIKDSGDVHVRLDKQLETLLNNPSFHEGFLRGRFAGNIGTDDARGRRYHLHLEAKLRDQVLNGPVMAITLPDGRGTSAVTHWVELKRESTPAAPAGSTSSGPASN